MTEDSYDYVGAGSAGAVLAARLSEDAGRSVLLLEAGGEADEVRIPAAFPRCSRPAGTGTTPPPSRNSSTAAGRTGRG